MKAVAFSSAHTRHLTIAALVVFTSVLLLHTTLPIPAPSTRTVADRLRSTLSFLSLSSPSAATALQTWDPAPVYADIDTTVCTVERVPYDELSPDFFFRFYEERQPVILHYPVDTPRPRNFDFQQAVQRHRLLKAHGSSEITLSTGNRNSYAKRNTTLADYIAHYIHPQQEDVPGNASWYHFGDPHHRYWREVNGLYELPQKFMHAHQEPALSFGFAGSGTGVPFHTHGAVFAETVYGRKRWWLSPPLQEPRYDPDANTLQWLRRVWPTYTAAEAAPVQECVCGRGDVIYIPSHWHHATLNVGETVFMSVFL